MSPEIIPLDTIEERLNLQGIPFKESSIIGAYIKDVDLTKADLSSAKIGNSIFENVIFNGCSLADITDYGNTFTNCIFIGSSFHSAGLGYEGSKYERCVFEKADFKKASFIRAEMNDCCFSHCNFKGVDLNASSFENCTFEGKLEDVWFRGGFALPSIEARFGTPRKNRMKNVDFSEAELWDVTISDNCDLTTIILPTDGNHIFYDNWKMRLSNLVQKAKADALPDDILSKVMVFAKIHLVHAKTQNCFLININEIKRDYGEEITSIILKMLDNSS